MGCQSFFERVSLQPHPFRLILMLTQQALQAILDNFPRIHAGHLPTPIDALTNLGVHFGVQISVKRDDCTGVAFGGNKVRQLEFYLGDALARHADTLLITGAVQSNFVRTAAAMAAKLNLECHVQLEDRVSNTSAAYHRNGNVLLDKLFGSVVHRFPEGEDEAAADAALELLADELRGQGATPYIIRLGAAYPPVGALGYVAAALELVQQLPWVEPVDEIVVCSGSALTHVGILVGLRLLELDIPILGVCVRRDARQQTARVVQRVSDLIAMLDCPLNIPKTDIRLDDGALAPGYGQLNQATVDAIKLAATREGLLLDPVYTGKGMAGLLQQSNRLRGKHVLFWHTGGQPAMFAYQDQLADASLA